LKEEREKKVKTIIGGNFNARTGREGDRLSIEDKEEEEERRKEFEG